jgi:hypothetical protein
MQSCAGETFDHGAERMASAGERKGVDRALGALVFAIVVAWAAGRSWSQYRPLTYLLGDAPYYAMTAVSLVQDHDLDLRNQLRGGLEVHGKQIALGRDGEWFPKHPVLMAVAAAPFLVALGIPGLLAFNILVLGALAVAMMRLARPAAPPWAGALAALLLVLGTFLRRYDYDFSPDLFATLVLVLGLLALARGRDGAAGALLGLGVAARLAHVLLLPLALAYAGWCRGRRGFLRSAAGCAPTLLALALLNLALFGSPLTTPYDRNVVRRDGDLVVVSHRGLFDGDPVRGVAGQLFDPSHGLLPTSPIILLALPGVVLHYRRRPREALLYLAVGEFLLLFFGTYRYWAASHYGPRFLMPLVALAAPSMALTLEHLAALLRGWRAGRLSQSGTLAERPAGPAQSIS